MKRLGLAFAFWAAFSFAAFAQVGGLSFPGPGPRVASGAAYTGPGDITTFQYYYALRAYSSAKRGTAAINLCDNAGANCADVSTSASTGVLNAPGTRGAVNCSVSNTCLIAKFYDQTGGGADCTQGTAANMPVFNNTSGPGGTKPTAVFSGTQSCAATASALGGVQPFTASMVSERTGNFAAFNAMMDFGTPTGDPSFLYDGIPAAGIYAGSIATFSAADSAYHAVQGLFNAASSAVYIDGTNNTASAGTNVAGTTITIGNGVGGPCTCNFQEGGAVAGNLSANFATVNTNQHTFWGF